MKLPDFTSDAALDDLRARMKAELRDFVAIPPTSFLTIEEIEQLATIGIEIPIDQVQVLNDGTHVYKGRRVVVYIRDVANFNGRFSLPKYHLALCDTLAKMMEHGRYEARYVVANREDGCFRVHKIEAGAPVKQSEERLDVCQNCLQQLQYKGFFSGLDKDARRARVSEFSLAEFFREYGLTCVWATPRYDEQNAPLNVYSSQFFRIANAIKKQRGFRCEDVSCRRDLSRLEDQRFLHAHHKDADKSNNDPKNIQLLCIYCHAKTFQHSHVKQMPDYKKFTSKFNLAF